MSQDIFKIHNIFFCEGSIIRYVLSTSYIQLKNENFHNCLNFRMELLPAVFSSFKRKIDCGEGEKVRITLKIKYGKKEITLLNYIT